jgi:hypothetical protein
MENPTHAPLARLRESWPGWTFWAVPRAVGGFIWCARPLAKPTPVLNSDSPEDLDGQGARQQS